MATNWQDTYEKLKKKKEALDAIAGNDIISNSNIKFNTSSSSSSKKKDDEEDTWFKAGAFDDGYDIGDITKTILGTVGDAAVGVVKGVGNLGEGLLDLGTYAASGVADLFGNEEAAERIKRRGQETLVNDWLAPLENRVNENSLLGNKADNITQGLGYVGGILLTGGLGASAGLGTAGTTALTTGVTGFSGMGSGMSEAYQGGATDKEAVTYGAIAGLAEAGTELIFGGLGKAVGATGLSVGLSSADDMLAKKISSKFSNQIAKNFTEYGIKAGAEGLEEVMSGFLQGVGKYYTYQTEQDGFNLKQILEDEKLLDQFIAGAVTSGIAQSGIVPGMKNGSLIEANKTGRDFITGYTQNEQAVIDAEIAARTEGKQLTNKQKTKIEEEVIEDFEKGYISTDRIESTIGGDTYNELKSLRDNKTNLETQIKELENKPNAEITVKEMEHLNALREELKSVNTNTLESKLQDEIGQKIQSDSYLQRSYQEKAKRSQEFTYETAEKDSEFRKGVMESTKGKLNDTTRSHETAESLVKLSEDRKMQYKFTNNAELTKLGLVPEGKTANGLYVVDKDGTREILVNTDSKKYIEAVLVHETAHDFKTTSPETYTKLQDITREFAEAQQDYSRIYSEVAGMYKNVEGVDINEEVTSRLLEDYLGNKEFISSLTTKEPNIVQKIINEIKYLYKKFTAGSPEARKLLELQHTLEETYREAYKQTKATDTKEGTKYSVTDNQKRELSKEQQEYFKDSKAREDDGSLTTVYHTSPNAGFTVFEGHKGEGYYRFSKYGAEIAFFTDNKVMSESYSRKSATSGTYEGYLNLKNPLIVDAEGRNWDRVTREHSQEIADRYNKLTDIEKDYLMDLASWEDARLFANTLEDANRDINIHNKTDMGEDVEALASAYKKLKGTGFKSNIQVNFYDTYEIAQEDFSPEAIEENSLRTLTTNDIVEKALEDGSYDGVIIKNVVDFGPQGGILRAEKKTGNDYVIFNSNQFKNADNLNPTENRDINLSLSNEADTAPTSTRDKTAPQDIRLEVEEAIAPLKEEITQLKEELRNFTDVDYSPAAQEVVEQQGREEFNTLEDADMPIEVEEFAPASDKLTPTDSLFDTRDYEEVGNRKINAYQYDNPEVRPYFQTAAREMLTDLQNSTRGERFVIGDASQMGDGDYYYSGTKRATTDDIAELLDGMGGKYNYTYAEIEKGLRAIIEDNGKENNAVSKRIEFYLDKRLREGYTDIDGYEIPADTDYLDMLRAKGITDYYNSIPVGEAPVESVNKPVDNVSNSKSSLKAEAIRPAPDKDTHGYRLIRVKTDTELQTEANEEIAKILTEEPATENTRNKRKWAILKANVLDKGIVFEDVALKHKNRELMGKWDYTLTAEARGQNVIGNGHYEYDPYSKTSKQVSKSLNDIRAEVDNTGLTAEFYDYIYHKHNVDRMRLEGRYEGMENKPVFGYNVTSEQSQQVVNKYETQHPEFITFAQDVYDYLDADRQVLVDNGVISQETADLWKAMYPHYVPIRRTGHTGNSINVPLDTGRTGVNAPIKKATGGNKDILPLFDTMASRTLQTYRATAKNSFGVELKNTIGTTINSQATNVDEVIDSIDAQEDLLQEGKNGQKPTFTVFENGEKVTFEITPDMYDALKPLDSSSLLSKTFLPFHKASNFHRGLLTQYSPIFMAKNALKDIQDVLLNSQHTAKTYAKVPEATAQLINKGYWYQEYMNYGGEQNSYFDSVENTFKTENKGLAKILDLPPLKQIAQMNDFVERIPRLAEYIASREAGRSIEVSMLDAARVTTNFKAGGNLTKWANRNGATFLNASVQGAMQQVRNIREANANGIRGWANLATKFALAGIPALILNGLIWEDDEEYEELSDYVKQNYYIVAKNDDGTFIRIPKGRAVAVIQEGIQQMKNLATGEDEADLKTFIDLFLTNLAPNNPIENNILSPIIQVANNKTWYGEDLVPMRLQNLPAAEQYDEGTDSFSRWLGEKTNISPVKINYLLDQYSGGLGDVVLPMLTPEAKTDADTLGEQLLAPLKSAFTTNAVMNNQNVTDFYDTSEKLTTEAKKTNATDEDILSNKYINSVKAEMNELYAEKREIQNSDLPNSEKYQKVLEVQSQINELTKEALNSYKDVNVYSNYATAGDRQYRINSDGEWEKINDKQLEKQDEVTSTLGISPNDYWSNKEEYDYAYENPSKYALANAISDYSTFKELSSELYDIKADKDENGKSISGTRKEKVFDYINNLDLAFEQRVMLAKLEYPSYDEYNYEIIEYLNNREDISYEQMVSILTELGFTVKKDGTITWD